MRPAALQVRGLAGSVKIQDTALDDVIAPFEVERTEPLHEMGVLYPPGVPSPMESVLSDPPIVVDGLIAKTGAPEKATAPRSRAPAALTCRVAWPAQAAAPLATRSSTSSSAGGAPCALRFRLRCPRALGTHLH